MKDRRGEIIMFEPHWPMMLDRVFLFFAHWPFASSTRISDDDDGENDVCALRSYITACWKLNLQIQ